MGSQLSHHQQITKENQPASTRSLGASGSNSIASDSNSIASYSNSIAFDRSRHHDDSENQLCILGVEQMLAKENYYTWLLRDESRMENLDISHMKINKSPYRRSRIAMLGSCNGLVCARVSEDGTKTVLWNPTTKEFRYLPKPITLIPRIVGPPNYVIMGFGYDDHNKDYKLVRYELGEKQQIEIQVFTQSSNSWRQLIRDLSVYTPVDPSTAPVALNGALHWYTNARDEQKEVIFSFNLRDEEFFELPAPPLKKISDTFRLAKWRGSLVALHNRDFWVMMSDTEEPWTKLFTISMAYRIYEPWLCGIWKDQLLVYYDECKELILYEHPAISGESLSQRSQQLKKLVGVAKQVDYRFNVLDYVESQVSVHPLVSSS